MLTLDIDTGKRVRLLHVEEGLVYLYDNIKYFEIDHQVGLENL